MTLIYDSSRWATPKERAAFEARLRRLRGAFGEAVERTAAKTRESFPVESALAARGFRVRPSFSYRSIPAPGGYSDRKVPPRRFRPPATRISSSQGSALRFFLMTLAVAQLTKRAGSRPDHMPLLASSDRPGWTDFVVTDAEDQGRGKVFIPAKEKRARSIRSSLKTLDSAGLVALQESIGGRGRYENFLLLDEAGSQFNEAGTRLNEVELYKVPMAGTPTINLPADFIKNSWLHVLEDSEISLLLMIAYGRGSLPDEDGYIAIPSETRLRHYGIGRDPFSHARKTLEWLGLVDVREVGRHEDGRAEGEDGPFLHRFALKPEGFAQPGLATAIATLEEQIRRSEKWST
jgi:hypothetical protein